MRHVARLAFLILLCAEVTALGGGPVSAAATGRIALVRSGGQNPGIYTQDADGSNPTLVVPFTGERRNWAVGGLDITDDGSMIAMTFLPRNKGHIYLVDADGSNFRRLTTGGDDSDPSFSPDGSQLVFSRYNGRQASWLLKIDTDGTDLVRLTGKAEPRATFPAWSPDGTMIAFTWIGHEDQYLVVTGPTGVWFRFVLYRPRSRGQLFTPEWSPDSSTIVFSVYDSNFINADLWKVQVDGSALTQLTDTPKVGEVSAAYSPDGSMIACVLEDPYGGFSDVLTMNADGTGRSRIKTDASEFNLAWGG